MRQIGAIDSPEGHGNVAMVGGYLMVIYSSDGGGRSRDGGIEFWDVSNPRQPVLFKRYDDERTHALREPHGFAFSPSYPFDVMVAQTEQGVQFWNVTDPANLELLSTFDLPHIDGGDYAGIWWVFFQAPYVYAAGVGEGLYVIDARDPRQPVLANWISTGELGGVSPAQVFGVGNLLILAEHEGAQMVTLDVSDPIHPALIASERGAFGYSHLFSGGMMLTSGGPQLESVLPILQGGEPIPAPRTMGITDIGHDGSIAFRKHAPEGGLDQGGYGSVQDGFFFSGFSKQVAKFDLDAAVLVGTASTSINDRDEDFGQVLGNLIWGGNDHGQATGLFAHQAEPDTHGPEVTWIQPPDGADTVPVGAAIGVSMSDNIDWYSLDEATFRVTGRDGVPVAGKFSVQMGLVNFVPDAPLRVNADYEVRIEGVRDISGNPSPLFVSRFTTADRPSPRCRFVKADTSLPPIRTGEVVEFVPEEIEAGRSPRFVWDFGDGTEARSDEARVSHAYDHPGRYNVVLSVEQGGGRSSCSAVQVVFHPPTALPPSVSSTIAYSAGRVFAVNADSDTVSAIDGASLAKLWETTTGAHPRTLSVAPDGRIFVVNQDDATITVLRPTDGSVESTMALPPSSQPFGIAVAPDGRSTFVTLQARRSVLRLDATGAIRAEVALAGKPRGVSVSADSSTILVSRFVSGADRGEVWRMSAASFESPTAIALHYDEGPDTEKSGRGVPNFLAAPVISPDGLRAIVPSKKDNTARGLFRDGKELTFESRVRTIVSQIDLVKNEEIANARIDLNDRDMAQAAVFSPYGDIFFAVTQGTNTVEVVDTYRNRTIASIVAQQFDEVQGLGRRVNGLAPQGAAIDPEGTRLYVNNFLSRSVSVYDITSVVRGIRNTAPFVREVKVVGRELLGAGVLLGKRAFYNASDPRMSRDSYISCASCHVDGTSDGQVWDFTQAGEGLRNTIDLTGRAGLGHGRVHWTANFDEIQDFENDIRLAFSGKGFLRDDVFARTRDPLGPPKARGNGELDAISSYVSSLNRFPSSPYRNPDGSLTEAGMRGRDVFLARGCWTCHAGNTFTDGLRHDVGTILASSGTGIGVALNGIGFDTPTLKGLWDSAPYLHDGRAETLDELLDEPMHMGSPIFSELERDDLVEYLLQIDDDESAPPPVGATP